MLFVPHNASDMVGFYLCGQAKSPLDTRANNTKNRLHIAHNPKGPSTQYLGTWALGNSNYSTGLGRYMIIEYLDP